VIFCLPGSGRRLHIGKVCASHCRGQTQSRMARRLENRPPSRRPRSDDSLPGVERAKDGLVGPLITSQMDRPACARAPASVTMDV